MPFSDRFVDKFIAPGISEFRTAEIPDMRDYDPESKSWLANFVLNSGLRGNYKAPGNAYVYNYLRRAVAAFGEHEQARRGTLGFLSSGGQSLSRYADALLHWEFFLGQSWHAYVLLRGFAKFLSDQEVPRLFVAGEGTTQERLNHLYNQMKHVESRIENAQIIAGATVPVWLTNDGIRSTDVLLRYSETGEMLPELAKWAGRVVDPIEMGNKLHSAPTD